MARSRMIPEMIIVRLLASAVKKLRMNTSKAVKAREPAMTRKPKIF
jgi:hypothetical protein